MRGQWPSKADVYSSALRVTACKDSTACSLTVHVACCPRCSHWPCMLCGAAHQRPCMCLVPVCMPECRLPAQWVLTMLAPAACSKMASYTAPQSVMQTIPDDDGDQVSCPAQLQLRLTKPGTSTLLNILACLLSSQQDWHRAALLSV